MTEHEWQQLLAVVEQTWLPYVPPIYTAPSLHSVQYRFVPFPVRLLVSAKNLSYAFTLDDTDLVRYSNSSNPIRNGGFPENG